MIQRLTHRRNATQGPRINAAARLQCADYTAANTLDSAHDRFGEYWDASETLINSIPFRRATLGFLGAECGLPTRGMLAGKFDLRVGSSDTARFRQVAFGRKGEVWKLLKFSTAGWRGYRDDLMYRKPTGVRCDKKERRCVAVGGMRRCEDEQLDRRAGRAMSICTVAR